MTTAMMGMTSKICLLLSVGLCLAQGLSPPVITVRPPLPLQRSNGVMKAGNIVTEGCEYKGRTVEEGKVIRVFNHDCILSTCHNGVLIIIKGDCVDSYGRCHAHGQTWRQGCRQYRCHVSKKGNADGSVSTKYEPVKIADCSVL